MAHLAERCGATLKKGSRFEGWGADGTDFLHRFQPASLFGYHFDAAAIVEVLESKCAGHPDRCFASSPCRRLRTLSACASMTAARCSVTISLMPAAFPAAGAADLRRSHPARLDSTGRAMVRRLPPQPSEPVTRVVARPHGWMFVIPLRDWISCGYVFNPRINSDAEVAADHTAFLHEQGVFAWEERLAPSFPNFIRRKMFDGRVFWTGNAALFIEPLEATTIGHAVVQVRWATRWISGRRAGPLRRS